MANAVAPTGVHASAARTFHLTTLIRMLLWTPLGLWVAWPQVAESVSIHPPTLASPILIKHTANQDSIQVATVLMAAVCLMWGTLLEAGRRASLDPDKADKPLPGRLGAVFAFRDAKSMHVWTSFDCLETIVWTALSMAGHLSRNPHFFFGFVNLIGVAVLMVVLKRLLAAVSYTQGDDMSDWMHGTATPLLAKAMCFMFAMFILGAQAVVANPYPVVVNDQAEQKELDKVLEKALVTVIDAGNYSAINCHDESSYDEVFAPLVNCSELSTQPLCGYRTWADLCRAWRVAPLSVSTPLMIFEMNFVVFFLIFIGFGLAGNERARTRTGIFAPHMVLIFLLVLCMCLLFVLFFSLTLLQLPMLMLGQPPVNPGWMASNMHLAHLATWLSVAAVLLLPIDTINRFYKSRYNRGRSYFVSYKQDDGNDGAVQMLANLLTKDGSRVWLDKLVEDRSEKGMVKGVQESDIFVAVISKSYFASWFCCLEMRTALQEGKPVLVVWNQSKHTVQAALGWLPSDLSFLKNDELLPIQEDIQMAGTCTYRIKAATVKPRERLALHQVGEHIFEQSSKPVSGLEA